MQGVTPDSTKNARIGLRLLGSGFSIDDNSNQCVGIIGNANTGNTQTKFSVTDLATSTASTASLGTASIETALVTLISTTQKPHSTWAASHRRVAIRRSTRRRPQAKEKSPGLLGEGYAQGPEGSKPQLALCSHPLILSVQRCAHVFGGIC